MSDEDFHEPHLDPGDTDNNGRVYWVGTDKPRVIRSEWFDIRDFNEDLREGDHMREDEQGFEPEEVF